MVRPVDHAVSGSAKDDSNEKRFTPAEYKFPQVGNPGTGSSGIGGIETVTLKGNPDEAVVVQLTGFGPSSTEYVDATQDPRKQGKQN